MARNIATKDLLIHEMETFDFCGVSCEIYRAHDSVYEVRLNERFLADYSSYVQARAVARFYAREKAA